MIAVSFFVGKLQFNGLRPKFGIRNYPSFARGSAVKNWHLMPRQQALITNAF